VGLNSLKSYPNNNKNNKNKVKVNPLSSTSSRVKRVKMPSKELGDIFVCLLYCLYRGRCQVQYSKSIVSLLTHTYSLLFPNLLLGLF
jgi:hypothetical protein